jgi:hypothetical protein
VSSNGDWGVLVEHDPEAGDIWDGFDRLPEAGENPILDSFVERKNITIESLIRLGARLSDTGILAYVFPGGIKYRDMVTDSRWNYTGSDFKHMKIVPATQGQSPIALVSESETDAARLTILFPAFDVAVLPAGAKRWTPGFAEQLAPYDRVLVALDNDEAGDQGAAKIIEALPHAERFRPPEGCKDWGQAAEATAIPDEPERRSDLAVLMPAGDMLELEVPEIASWFEHDILPIGGLAILHGWAKSFKTFLAIDMMAALAQGQDWACFEPTEEACRIAVVQFELPWSYYRQRVANLLAHAREPDLFRQNFLTYSPLARPRFRAGNTKEEDALLKQLVDGDVQVLLMDPIRRATGAIDMNNEGDVRPMLNFFERVNNEGITVVATHHDNKTAAKAGGGDPTGMTGSGAWSGDPDSLFSVELPHGDKYTESVRRNIIFTLRHSPIIPPRGFSMNDEGQLLYSPSAFSADPDLDDGSDEDAPPI